MARLRAVSEKIEELQAALPQPVDTRLAHYLQRRSYDKALESWKIRSGAHGGERRSVLVPALLANRKRITNGFDQAPIPFSC